MSYVVPSFAFRDRRGTRRTGLEPRREMMHPEDDSDIRRTPLARPSNQSSILNHPLVRRGEHTSTPQQRSVSSTSPFIIYIPYIYTSWHPRPRTAAERWWWLPPCVPSSWLPSRQVGICIYRTYAGAPLLQLATIIHPGPSSAVAAWDGVFYQAAAAGPIRLPV